MKRVKSRSWELCVFNRKRRKRRLKKNVKRFLIMGLPVLILVGGFYISFNYLSQASESTFNPGKYYENPSDNNEDLVYNNTDNKNGDSEVKNPSVTEVITNHEDVTLDTNPDSITVLVNKELSLPSDYVPSDLVVPEVAFSFNYYDEKKLMRKEAADALAVMFNAASNEGLALNGVSAYRSYDRQYEIFTNNVKVKGLDHTTKYSAIPGYSEHQTGLSIDVSAKACNNRLDASFAKTKESEWLIKNAHLYGFIIRYPEDKTAITGYSYEPWHIRYVGIALATYIYENNLCLEEYYNYIPSIDYTDAISYDNLETYGIDPDDVKVPTKAPTKVPTLTPTPTPTPTEEPTEIPSQTPTPTPTKKPDKGDGSGKVTPTPTNTPTPTIGNSEGTDGGENTGGGDISTTPDPEDSFEVVPTPDPY